MKKTIAAAISILLAVMLLPAVLAAIAKLEAQPIANGVIRVTFTLSNSSAMKHYSLFRENLVVKQREVAGDPFYDLYDDLDTENNKQYTYTLKVLDLNNELIDERSVSVGADSEPPQLVSDRKILSKLNTLTVRTNEDAFCKAGVSETNLFPMDGKSKIHTLRMALVNGHNVVYVLCEDSVGNSMRNLKMIEYTYDSIPPGQMKNIDILNHIPGVVTISWPEATDANGIKEYRIYKRGEEDAQPVMIGVTKERSFADTTNLREGKVYFYNVAAVDNADNEGSKSKDANITIYNMDVFLDVPKNYSTKSGNVIIRGKASGRSQIVARLDSKVYETTAGENGDFELMLNTDRSRLAFIEAIDDDGNSKVETVAITRLPPDVEVSKTVLVREEETNLIYLFLIAFLFFAVIFIIIYSTKRSSLYGDIDHYMKKRRKGGGE